MNFSRIISDLLIKNQKVSIPGIGKFTYSYISAELYKFSNRVAPPAHKLEFSSFFDPNDNSFIETCAQEYDSSIEETKGKVAQWVMEINKALNVEGQYVFDQIGVLKNESGKLSFITDEKGILFADTYGLESAKIPLMEIDEPQIVEPKKETVITKAFENPIRAEKEYVVKSKNSKGLLSIIKKTAIAIATLLLLFIGAYFLYENGILESGYNVVAKWFKTTQEEKETVVLSDSAEALKRSALHYSEQQYSDTSIIAKEKYIVYYIVAGSFKSMENANKEVEILRKKGLNPEVLNMNDTLFRVTIGSYRDRRRAVEEYIALTNQESGLNIWLFSQLNR